MRGIEGNLCAAGLALGLLAAAAPGFAATVKTYNVDCTKGESINAALAKNGDELIIRITGMCRERVVIRRDLVTLRGADPAVDGILGVADGEGLVEVWNADNSPSIFADRTSIKLENLGIRGDDTTGLTNYDSALTLTNCQVTDHAGSGIHISGSGFLVASDSEFSRNAGNGVNVQRNGRFICERCLFADNGVALRVQANGEAFLAESTMSGPTGAVAQQQGRIQAETTDVTAADFAFFAVDGAQVLWLDSTISGSVAGRRDAFLRLFDLEQIANPVGNTLGNGSNAQISGGTLLGLDLFVFANAQIAGASVGDLTCGSGADAFCDGSETKTSSSCGLCP